MNERMNEARRRRCAAAAYMLVHLVLCLYNQNMIVWHKGVRKKRKKNGQLEPNMAPALRTSTSVLVHLFVISE